MNNNFRLAFMKLLEIQNIVIYIYSMVNFIHWGQHRDMILLNGYSSFQRLQYPFFVLKSGI